MRNATMRCPECGFPNSGEASRCRRCGEAWAPSAEPCAGMHGDDNSTDVPHTNDPPSSDAQAVAPAAPVDDAPEPDAAALRSPSAAAQTHRPRVGGLGNAWLAGTVIAAEPVHDEPPDLDAAATLHRLLLLAEFLGLPALLLWGVLTTYSPASVVLGALGIYFLFRFLTPSNLLAMLNIVRRLHPTRADDPPVPVQHVRLRDRAEREHLVRRKGVLRGHVMPGDEVALYGRWRRGIFRMRGGVNRRTGAQLAVAQRRSWVWLGLNLLILIGLIWLFREPVQRTLASLAA